MQRLRLIVIVVVLIFLGACVQHKRSNGLTETLNAYAATLRWNGFEQAQGFVAPEYRQEHPLTPLQVQRYKQVTVAGYDDGHGPIPVDENTVKQVVRVSLINRHTQRERDVVDRQTWKWDAEAGRWWLTSGLPKITSEQAPSR